MHKKTNCYQCFLNSWFYKRPKAPFICTVSSNVYFLKHKTYYSVNIKYSISMPEKAASYYTNEELISHSLTIPLYANLYHNLNTVYYDHLPDKVELFKRLEPKTK